ncbi:MAG: putative multidrug export ATP-binding/permease protein [Anaerolineales bacterium]|nr:putative multidrug export ATP-binding/permease protein [Anaerolineales bacterium]
MTTITPPAYVVQSEEALDKKYDPQIARKLIAFIHPYRRQAVAALILNAIATFTAISGPYFVKLALDNGIAKSDPTALRSIILLYLFVMLIQWGSNYLRVRIMSRVGQYVLFDVRTKMFEHLQKLSLGFYSRFSVGRAITRVINDVGTLREFVTWAMLAILRDVFGIVGIIIAMLLLDVKLSLLTFAVFPLMVLATLAFRKAARRNYRKVRSAISWVNSVLAENINGVRVVQAFSREKHNYQNFRDYVNRYHLDVSLDAARVASVFAPVADMLGAIATALVVYIGGTAVLGETMTAGVLVAFVLYIDRFFEPVRDLFRRFDTLQSTMAGGERILQLLETPIEVRDEANAGELPVVRGDVRFDHVSFHYSDDPTPVLTDIDLDVRAGETVALVGETGAGKTTFVKLVARFHDPTSGGLRVDGVDLRTVTQSSLRKQMGMVLQDPFLFNGTVKENILFGRLNASDEDVIAAATAVGAHDFIAALKKGYDTSVEEGGVLLSVGQRQLISFARALLADPRILILDEATSSVDTQTEQVIQSALARLLKGRTSFVIAHRLSTITNADRIVVIEGGQIAEQGRHEELLARRGKYFHLYKTGFQE